MTIYLGTQGWSYPDWVGSFYPTGARQRDFLALYAEVFDAVELDTTFYATPRDTQVEAWRDATPEGFQFTAKVPRTITHDRHLVGTDQDMDDFLTTMTLLGDKLGAVLVQLPPDFRWDERAELDRFLARLPRDVRTAVEFRNRSWIRPETAELLAQYGVAFTMIDLHYMPRVTETTADFTYVRWLGERSKITRMHETQIDRHDDLDRWAAVLGEVAMRVQRVYGFANNHYSGHSPADIRYLKQRLDLPERERPSQGRLL
ncbi:MAG TPA: DUF72 domain-containing protein [Chloroflexota bacterium]|nr:DUF72 domain-containing protein [Chloroflexota bacterium]